MDRRLIWFLVFLAPVMAWMMGKVGKRYRRLNHAIQEASADMLQTADQGSGTGGTGGIARYSLGGFHRLSGYQNGQLVGNHALLLRAGWTMRLSRAPTLTRGFFLGATLEAGNTWLQRSDVSLRHLRTGMSVYLGADTGIGPLYFGITYAPLGQAGLALFIGRP